MQFNFSGMNTGAQETFNKMQANYDGYITIKDVGIRLKLCVANYVTEILYASYFLKLTEMQEKYKMNTVEIEEGMQELYLQDKRMEQ